MKSSLMSGCVLWLAMLCIAGCKRDDMANQPKMRPMRQSEVFADGSSARPLVAGTVARDQMSSHTNRYAASTQPGSESATFPFAITEADLARGRARFDIYCAVCHGRTGEGDGMIVQRGFARPPAYFPVNQHRTQFPMLYPREQVLLTMPPGHFYSVITNGYGAMYSYADRVASDDRWRIAAYIRALQLARTIKANDLPAVDRPHVFATTQSSTQQSAEVLPR